MTRDAYVVLVVLQDLHGMGGPITLHTQAGGPRLDVVGVAPVYLDREQARRDWPGATVIPVTVTTPDPTEDVS